MLATTVKRSWMAGAFAFDIATVALAYPVLPFPIQMYSLFALCMDAFVCVREFFFDNKKTTASFGSFGFEQTMRYV